MLRRLTVVLTGLLVSGFLATGVAAAAPADGHHQRGWHRQHPLTPREREGLRIAGQILDTLFGGDRVRGGRF
ncbi:hypothetical protein ACIQU1_09140 [Streptomyces angustmyceticus]|uniref:hypothetical protein n=1 Tax=Streptomyces angustmyceticus TaxID=285578 RepID=UPI00344FE46A